jgi:ElaB/YqjD/DUF883 family membrane-anchored ribosome-binding protein
MKTQYEREISQGLSKAEELQENLKEGAQKAARATTQYVEENPWKTIAIVAVCALALGFLLRPTD